ncbi:MAG: Rpn family recombination-promoting nuclease/putative transposase [Acidobacteriota bacterium]
MAEPNYHDLFFREVMAQPKVIADFLANYLPADVAPLVDVASAKLIPGTFVDKELCEHRSDLIFRLKMTSGETAYVYIILEHKSFIYPLVSWQVLKYAVPTWEAEARGGATTLTPVLPMIFYHGKEKWNVAREFSALFDWSGREALRQFTPEFRYALLDLSKLPDDRIKGGWQLRAALIAFKHIYDRQSNKLRQHLIEVFTSARGRVGIGALGPLLHYLVGVGRVAKPDIEQIIDAAAPQNKEVLMTTLAKSWKQELMQEVRQEVRQEGRQEGRLDALQKLLLRQLAHRFGVLDEIMQKQIFKLPLESLETLGEAWLDFTSLNDLANWLDQNETAQ